jgi:hypothetical protein
MDTSHIQALLVAWSALATLFIVLLGRVVVVAIQQWEAIKKALDNHADHITSIEQRIPEVPKQLGEPEKVSEKAKIL